MKKILLLGGSNQQIIAIETAKRLGLYTVLCDYLPDNPGQHHADKFYLVSTTDKEAVLQVAKTEQVNGVLAYASDPAAPTAAYVAEQLGLPANPYRSVETLCNKDLFRAFLTANGFHAPRSHSYSDGAQIGSEISHFHFPVLVKPVDSSGSKGVTVLRDDNAETLRKAVDYALSYSRSHRFLIEEFIEKKHPYLVGGDIFVIDGKISLWGLMNCHRDAAVAPLVPVGKSYPPCLEETDLQRIKDCLQRLADLLRIQNGAMNVELIIDRENRVWPIDIGPRNGGNMIPDLLGMIFGVDLVEMTVRTAMGESLSPVFREGTKFYATHNLHSSRGGAFERIDISPEYEHIVVRKNIYKKPGDPVQVFANSSHALGILFLKFDTMDQMLESLNHTDKWLKVVLKEGS